MAEDSIRVVIAEDVLPIREYLYMVLSHEPDMKVLAAVDCGTAAVEKALSTKPDVVLMDLEMETPRAGVDAIRIISNEAPQIRSVVLTHFEDSETVFAAFEAGAVDYILKNASASEILEAVRAAAQDRSPIRSRIAKMIREEFQAIRAERANLTATLNIVYKLTPTELSLLRLLAEGHTQSEIARIRHVEFSTIRTHIGNILKKFNEPTVRDVVTKLKALGIFEIFNSE
ncbi:MAG: response regulator transcription factor [Firmicutes bacterium]|nr:response regulator transcription factor [Bacillota bacterium]